MGTERQKEIDRKLRRARIAAFWGEFSWKHYLGLAATAVLIGALALFLFVRFGPRTAMPSVVGREMSSFITPQSKLRASFLMSVELQDGRIVQVSLPSNVQHVPHSRMELRVYRQELGWLKSEVFAFERYLGDGPQELSDD